MPLGEATPSGFATATIFGRGSADMKGGVAVQLSVAAALAHAGRQARPVTWIFYDNEEVESTRNGLGRLARNHPDLLAGDFAVSFEFFPPRDEAGEETLWQSIRDLEDLRPTFVSVTYGAGGTTRDRTLAITERIARESPESSENH